MDYIPKPAGNVKYYFSGSSNNDYQNNDNVWLSISIINDGTVDLRLVINGLNIIVKPNEEFTDNFESFDKFSVLASDSYRGVARE